MKTRHKPDNNYEFIDNMIYEQLKIDYAALEKRTQSQIELEILLAIAKTHNFSLSNYVSVSYLVEALLDYLDDTDNKDDFLSVLSYKENELQ